MTTVTTLGFPRIGAKRELKTALESYWRGDTTAADLHDTARELRHRHWQLQRDAGADVVPCNDFALYDHVLDTAFLLDAIPDDYRVLADADPLAGYFALARGLQKDGVDLRALEMTKWFDTNYHYLVPELHAGRVPPARRQAGGRVPRSARRRPCRTAGAAGTGEFPAAGQNRGWQRSSRPARPLAAGLCRVAGKVARRRRGLGAGG